MKRLLKHVVVAGASLLALGLIARAAGARINTTKSIPVGLYWNSVKPAEKNDYVIFCPPSLRVFEDAKERGYIGAGFCPGGYGYMMKRVSAVSNDNLSFGDEGVRVNGKLLPYSAPKLADQFGRTMPRYRATHLTLNESEVLLMGDPNANSFDARYFGPISRSNVQSVIRPVFTW